MTTSASMEWQAPDSDVGLLAAQDAALWLAALAAGTNVTATQHNSAIAVWAIMGDMIARPDAAGFRTMGGASRAYVTQIYHGPWVAAQGIAIPVYGAFPAPAAGSNLTWWKGVQQFLRRLSDWTPATGTALAAATPPTLAAFAGAAADAIVAHRGATATSDLVTEDPQARAAVVVLAPAVSAYAQRALAAAAGQVSTAGAAEVAAAPTIAALAAEYDAENDTDMRQAGYVGAGMLAAAAAGGALLKGVPWPARRGGGRRRKR